MKKQKLFDIFTYNRDKFNEKIALHIVNTTCSLNFDAIDNAFELEIVELVNYIKIHNPELLSLNEDLIIFRIYEQILDKQLVDVKNKIHNSITLEQQVKSQKFIKKIFSLNDNYFCNIKINNKEYNIDIADDETFLNLVEFAFYSGNGTFLFYSYNNQITIFGFELKNNEFSEISLSNKEISKINSEFKDLKQKVTTFSQLNLKTT